MSCIGARWSATIPIANSRRKKSTAINSVFSSNLLVVVLILSSIYFFAPIFRHIHPAAACIRFKTAIAHQALWGKILWMAFLMMSRMNFRSIKRMTAPTA